MERQIKDFIIPEKEKKKTVSRTIQFTSGSFKFLYGFQRYLKKYGIQNTTISKYNRIVKATGTASTYGVLVINASIKRKDRSYLIQNTKTGRYKDAPKSQQALNQKKFFHLIYDKCSKDLLLRRKFLKLKNTIS